jgi:hypothetical protein
VIRALVRTLLVAAALVGASDGPAPTAFRPHTGARLPAEPPSYQCVVEATQPPPPHLADLCRFDSVRGAWMRPWRGRWVDARTVPRQESRLCQWFGPDCEAKPPRTPQPRHEGRSKLP